MLPTRTADDPLSRYAGTDNLVRAQSVTAEPMRDPQVHSPGLSVLILNLDRPDLLLPLLDVLEDVHTEMSRRGLAFETVVGDTGSTDPEILARYADAPAWLVVERDLDYQFSRCNNACAARATPYDRILLLNNDVVLPSPQAVLAMVDALDESTDTGIVGLCLDFPDGTVQHRGMDLLRDGPLRGFPFHAGARLPARHDPGTSFPAIATTGACLMIRTGLWEALGGLDEAYESECQDIDLCLAAHRLGWDIEVLDEGPVVHLENATRPAGDESWPDRRLLFRRWESYLEANFL